MTELLDRPSAAAAAPTAERPAPTAERPAPAQPAPAPARPAPAARRRAAAGPDRRRGTRFWLPGLARRCYRHRRLVVALWLALLAASGLAVALAGTSYQDDAQLPRTQSGRATALLAAADPTTSNDVDSLVVTVASGRVTDPAVSAAVRAAVQAIGRLPHVSGVSAPAQVSRDRRTEIDEISFDTSASRLPVAAVRAVLAAATRLDATDGVTVALGGQAAEKVAPPDTGGVGLGVALAGVVLLLAFGSLLAALLPLVTALVSLGTGMAIVGLTSHLLPTASFSTEVASLVGLGVGIDYALFLITRYRQALGRGRAPEAAVVEAVDTAGRAVIFAELTVCTALLGMVALRIPFLYGMAVAASVTVLLTAAASVTLLPALLGFAGTRALSRRERRRLRDHTLTLGVESRGWARWAETVGRRPRLVAGVATALMLLLALPVATIRLGSADAGLDPAGTTTRQAYDLTAHAFGPGANGPLELVMAAPATADDARLRSLLAAVEHDPAVAGVGRLATVGGTAGRPRVDVVPVISRAAPQDRVTERLLGRFRARAGAAHALVGGETATINDFSDTVSGRLPLFLGLVVLASSLLLLLVFRSVVIPLTAAALNLVSVAAAFGTVTAVFQHGVGASWLGVGTGPIEPFVPVMMFAVLFGLSMDYEVFILSHIHEEMQARRDTAEAVVHGLAATGRTVTAAAAIMVGVFAAFMLGGDRIIKLFGLGLSSAVALDALVIRAALLPAAMFALGRWNWRLPARLDRWLPRVNVEGGHAAPAADEP